jgi:hypothetical protein
LTEPDCPGNDREVQTDRSEDQVQDQQDYPKDLQLRQDKEREKQEHNYVDGAQNGQWYEVPPVAYPPAEVDEVAAYAIPAPEKEGQPHKAEE